MSFEECLNDCLDRLQRGESLEACLARYPEHADDLRGLLQAGQVLRASPPPLSATARSQGRERMHRAAELQAKKRWQLWPRGLVLPLAAAIVAVFLVVVAGAARSSAPSDLIYPLRHFAETAALRLTADPIGRAARHLELAEQRLAEVQERWQAQRSIDRGVLTEGVNGIGEALGELAQATSDPNRAKSVLAELAAVAYETRAWVLSVTPEAPAARDELEGIAAQLTVYEQWAQAGLFDLTLLPGFLRGETPPLLPTLLPQVPTAVPTPPAAAGTAGPIVTETQVIVAPTTASLATRTQAPTQPSGAATTVPTVTSTRLSGVSATPAQPAPISPTPTGIQQQSPVATPTLPPGTATPRPNTATATPGPITPTPTRPGTSTATPRPVTPTPTRPNTPTVTTPVVTVPPTETTRPATPTPTALPPNTPTATPRPNTPTPTDEPTETEEPTETPRPSNTPRPSDTPEPTETSRPTRTPEPSNTPESTTTHEPTETPEPTEQAAGYPAWVSGTPTAWPVSADSSAAKTTARSRRPSRAVIFGVLP